MSKMISLGEEALLSSESNRKQVSRRKFLTYAGAASGLAFIAAACHKDDDNGSSNDGINLGSGDIGILNYAYALEQLEAGFYLYVAAHPFSGITTDETAYLTDIRDHEVAHREFFKSAIPAANIIPGLEVDFSSIDFTSRASVLGTAKAFEDLGVSAYNGAGTLITNKDYLTIAGKIVSVEARHAALIRDMITANTFVGADIIDQSNGVEMSRKPSEVLSIAGKYLKSKINASNLPS